MGREKRTYGEERRQRRMARQEQKHRAKLKAFITNRVEELTPLVDIPMDASDATTPIDVTPFARRRCAAQTVHYRLPEASKREGVTIDASGRRHYAIDGQPVTYHVWYKKYAQRSKTKNPSKVRAKTTELMTDEQRAEFDARRMAAQQEQQRLKQEQRRLKKEQQQERQRMKRAQAREQRRLAREQQKAQRQEQRRIAQEQARAQRQEQRRIKKVQSQEQRREYFRQYNLERREQNRAYCREYWKKRRMQKQQPSQEQGA